jgi:hypothetical protein
VTCLPAETVIRETSNAKFLAFILTRSLLSSVDVAVGVPGVFVDILVFGILRVPVVVVFSIVPVVMTVPEVRVITGMVTMVVGSVVTVPEVWLVHPVISMAALTRQSNRIIMFRVFMHEPVIC